MFTLSTMPKTLQKKKLDEWWRAFETLRVILEVHKGVLYRCVRGIVGGRGIEGVDYGHIEGILEGPFSFRG